MEFKKGDRVRLTAYARTQFRTLPELGTIVARPRGSGTTIGVRFAGRKSVVRMARSFFEKADQ